MKKEFCVCYASSDEYAHYTGISILSLLENNGNIVDRVYLLSFGIKQDNIFQIKEIVSSYNVDIIVIDAIAKMSSVFSKLDMCLFEGSYATYARAFIAQIIDDYDGKLLYVDSDTIVDGSLLPLKELDLEEKNKVYAGVIGMNQYVFPFTETKMKNGNKIYYACGVLLFDLKMWRKMKCTERVINFIDRAKDKNFLYADQTVINNCIPEELAIPLDLEFNYWGHMFRGRREIFELTRMGFYTKSQVVKASKNPVIIHYKGYVVHPWLKGNVSLLEERFHFYKNISPWSEEEEKTIYYSEKDGMETEQQKRDMLETKKYLGRSYFSEWVYELLIRVKNIVINSGK